MMPADEAALQLFQAHRDTDRAVLAAMLDECLAPPAYSAELDIVRNCMCEECEMDDIEDVGHLTKGLRDNAKDVIDLFMMRAGRRAEFGERETADIREVVTGLFILLREIEGQEAA